MSGAGAGAGSGSSSRVESKTENFEVTCYINIEPVSDETVFKNELREFLKKSPYKEVIIAPSDELTVTIEGSKLIGLLKHCKSFFVDQAIKIVKDLTEEESLTKEQIETHFDQALINTNKSLDPLKDEEPDERTLDFDFFERVDPEYINRAMAQQAETAGAEEAEQDKDFDEDAEDEYFPVSAGAGVQEEGEGDEEDQRMLPARAEGKSSAGESKSSPGDGKTAVTKKRGLEEYSDRDEQGRHKIRRTEFFVDGATEMVRLVTHSSKKSGQPDKDFDELTKLFQPRPPTP